VFFFYFYFFFLRFFLFFFFVLFDGDGDGDGKTIDGRPLLSLWCFSSTPQATELIFTVVLPECALVLTGQCAMGFTSPAYRARERDGRMQPTSYLRQTPCLRQCAPRKEKQHSHRQCLTSDSAFALHRRRQGIAYAELPEEKKLAIEAKILPTRLLACSSCGCCGAGRCPTSASSATIEI